MTDRRYWDEEFECRSWDETQQWQVKQLAAVVARLREHSLLYADLLDAVDPDRITSLGALGELPMTGKQDLRRGQETIQPGVLLGRQQAVPSERIVQILSSSGTTGHPVYFGLTEADRSAWIYSAAAMFFTAGMRSSSVAALSTAMPIVAGGLPYADGIRATGAALVWLGGQPTARMVSTLQRVQVNTVASTVSFATFFADRVEEQLGQPASSIGVRTVITGGEPGMGEPGIRDAIVNRWGAERVSEIMGLCDVLPGIWSECEAGLGMHFIGGPDVLAELIDPDSLGPVAWSEGAEGELVYTTLAREATPVLRYRSRDHIRVLGVGCACGRTTPRIRCVGRTDDMLIYKGMNVFPSAIRDVALAVGGDNLDGLTRVRKDLADQVRFDEAIPVEVQLRHSLPDSAVADLRDEIEKAVRESLRVRVAVECHPAGTVPVEMYKNALTYVR